ncbi:MAG: ThiF family adenylyltransferase, partial [Thaumarchaeota archaeon]|nr:ThiF family adenylyltransferase [Nitrososphaerota archaeon]
SVFWATRGPCYRCLYPTPPPPESVQSCEDAGVLGMLPGVMGSLQAVQTIQILLGKGSPLVGRLLVFNVLDTSFDEVKTKKNPACLVCGQSPSIVKLIDYEEFCGAKSKAEPLDFDISPKELKAVVDQGRRVVLLDVREPFEYEVCHLGGAVLVPLMQLVKRKGELSPDKETVVYCHVGVRSTQAVGFLRREGFAKVRNLKGGIDAWSVQVDPKTPRY